MKKVRTKGINFRSLVGALRRLRGEVVVQKTFDLLPPEIGEPLRLNALTTNAWYSVEWYAALHRAAQVATGEGLELTRALARDGIKDDFKSGTYRLMTITLTPQSLIKIAQRVMALYWEGGRVVIEQAEHGKAMGRFDDFHGFDRNLWEDVVGGTIGALEIGGARNVQARIVAGGGNDDAHMVYVCRWEGG